MLSDDYRSCFAEHYPSVTNCPLAEQKNSILRRLERSIANMSQPNAMVYLRTVLFGMNQEQHRNNTGSSWLAP